MQLTGYIPAVILLLSTGLLSACGSDIKLPPVDPNSKALSIDFNDTNTDWKSGFADYPVGQESFYELDAGSTTLPASLATNRKGYKLSGNNHSDDLFMFITKKFEGLEPNTRYEFQFKVRFGTNAQKNCMGVGGAPGESVWIKAGASKTEPLAVNNGAGDLLMNIDKGNQAVGGSDAIVLGDFANSRECGDSNTDYMRKTLRSEPGAFSGVTAEDGSVWILLGTDSGFESTTTIYFMTLDVIATKR
ncbi:MULTISPECIES: hypothetical protein [unclassified Cellvibrio]|uniref:hypothetical protein n=1 Tax=unclassified Cellvibrio TaxID=2624793 RepID=UPI001248EA11|nr:MULTISPECIES: hypothetical protein [unclassified Cellvibrio]QEY11456.1 hypothetical protein D0B88_03765 [Cellvibrio sp. KY-YJ-3]UUA71580.1 hypothetical protein NNX04_14295 [Cellvibrio sp. QJXJ]